MTQPGPPPRAGPAHAGAILPAARPHPGRPDSHDKPRPAPAPAEARGPRPEGKPSMPTSSSSGSAPAPRRSAYKSKQMIVMRRDLHMRKGKIAAQAGHACVEAVLMALCCQGRLGQVRQAAPDGWVYLEHGDQDRSALTDWFDAGVAKVCVYVDSEEELLDIAARGRGEGFAVALVRDAGLTEFHGEATYTCLAFEPLPAELIDPVTGELPLY